MFQSHESGHIIQFAFFDTRRARMYARRQMQNLWDFKIHASASNTVLKKLTRTFWQISKLIDFLNLEI